MTKIHSSQRKLLVCHYCQGPGFTIHENNKQRIIICGMFQCVHRYIEELERQLRGLRNEEVLWNEERETWRNRSARSWL